MIRKVEVERFTLSSSKPFDEVVAGLNSAVAPDADETSQSQQDKFPLQSELSIGADAISKIVGVFGMRFAGANFTAGGGKLLRIRLGKPATWFW